MARMVEGNPKGLDGMKSVTKEPEIAVTESPADAIEPAQGEQAVAKDAEAPANEEEIKEPTEQNSDENKEASDDETTLEFDPPKTYKVKGQEFEYPEWAIPLMKDEESVKQFQEMFEKVGGFDHIKNDRETAQRSYDELVQHVNVELAPVIQQVNAANQFIQRGDYASFFQLCGIPMEKVLRFSLEFAQMNPVQRTALTKAATDNVNAYHSSIQQNSQMNTIQQQMVAMREREVSMVLSRPDIAQISRDIDARLGRVGILREEMIKRGNFYLQQGKDISAEQALNEVLILAGIQPGQGAPAQNLAGKAQVKSGTGTVQRHDKPVIKNVGTGGKSPAKPVIKNMDDLRKRRDQLAASGR